MSQTAYIVDAVRTPMGRGKEGGALADVHPVDLLAQTLQALLARTPEVDPGEVEDVIIGCVSQIGEQSGTPGRMAWLAAGFPEHVPSVTIERKCGSSQQSVHFGAQAIMAGVHDIVIAGGVESMSQVPIMSNRDGRDPFGVGVEQRYAPGLIAQGIAAELIAAKWSIDRETQDAFAVESHKRAGEAADSGKFDREIIPITTPHGVVDKDESIRRGSSTEKLATLPTPFASDEMQERFPQIEWSVTAGNASQITDGATAVLLMSEDAVKRLGVTPRAKVHTMTVVADDPILMLTGPIAASRKALEKSGLTFDDIGLVEVNEAFAPVPLAFAQELGVSLDKLNTRGGAIALGHPLGATGTRIFSTLLNALEDTKERYGLVSICEAGGMANATIIERV